MLPKCCSKGNNSFKPLGQQKCIQNPSAANLHLKYTCTHTHTGTFAHTHKDTRTHRQTLTLACVHTRIVNTGLRTKPQYGACFNFTCDAWMLLYVCVWEYVCVCVYMNCIGRLAPGCGLNKGSDFTVSCINTHALAHCPSLSPSPSSCLALRVQYKRTLIHCVDKTHCEYEIVYQVYDKPSLAPPTLL